MNSLYLVKSSNESLNLEAIKKLLTKFTQQTQKIGIFCPMLCQKHKNELLEVLKAYKLEQGLEIVFDFEEALKTFNQDKNVFFDKIINEFESLKAKNDFILILGFMKFGILGAFELNVKIAKELNTPLAIISEEKDKALASDYLKQSLENDNFIFLDEKLDLNCLDKLKPYTFLAPNRFRYELIQRAKKDKKIVVLPESDDERILKASEILLQDEIVDLILLGDKDEVQALAKKSNINLKNANIINPKNSEFNDEFAKILYEARKEKGMSEEEAKKLVCDRTYFGTLLVHTNKAHAMVSGASTTTAETIRPALQLIKTQANVSLVSGAFLMSLENKVLVFADCAVAPNPNPTQIAEIAYTTAQTAKSFGIDPKVAFLSYSTGNSGSGISVDATKEAVKIAKERFSNLKFEGPIQFDAACDMDTAKLKLPNSEVAGKANVFVFPDLNAANIGYKAVQRTANAIAIGPILQGLKKPVNDLSRGCLVDDIVSTVIVSAIQAQ